MVNFGRRSKSSVFSGSVDALVVVSSLEVGLQVNPCLIGCCLLAPFFAHRRKAPCGLLDIVAHAGLILRCVGVAASFDKGDTVHDLLEHCLNRVRWCPGRRHPRLVELEL